MYIARIANRNSPPALLLRESYREGDKVKTRTLANFSHLPAEQIEMLRRVFAGETLVPKAAAKGAPSFAIERSLGHGHVAAVLGAIRKLKLDEILPRRPDRLGKLIQAMIVARILEPAPKLATARQLSARTAAHSVGAVLELGDVDEDELYEALDLLAGHQNRLEEALARRHLKDGTLVLYDVSSSYLEGRHCELAQFGHSRDHRRDRMQIVYGLLCTPQGCPVAIEVFEGNTGDPKTLTAQIVKLKERFKLDRVIMVGDRGMITSARLKADIKPAAFDWITALRAPAIQKLAVEGGPLQLSLFDERDMAEITAQDFPGERLIVCRNPDLQTERARKRNELLAATEKALLKIQAQTQRKNRPLTGTDKIALKVGAVINTKKMAKHFTTTITDTGFTFTRKTDAINDEQSLDGIYVLRTSMPKDLLAAEQVVLCYKSLSHVERAFRDLKSDDLELRPIHHRKARRVRGHVLLCMLAYHVMWHMKRDLAPMLFKDHDLARAALDRTSPVAKAAVSPSARAKAATKRTADGQSVHSFHTLLQDLATLTRNTIRFNDTSLPVITFTQPTPLHTRAFQLLGLKLPS
jgi:Transposase DDE domain